MGPKLCGFMKGRKSLSLGPSKPDEGREAVGGLVARLESGGRPGIPWGKLAASGGRLARCRLGRAGSPGSPVVGAAALPGLGADGRDGAGAGKGVPGESLYLYICLLTENFPYA